MTTAETIVPTRDPWDLALERLRNRHPKATEGTLFCVHKLEQDPELTLRDFRDEARLRGIGLSGRSIHSAKLLLGVAAPIQPRRTTTPKRVEPKPPAERPNPRTVAPIGAGSDSLETTLLAAVQQIQSEATAETRRLRHAIRQAVEVLGAALDDEGR